ncbi:MAG: hypothetical protein QM708_14525 [Propioniciclava sp.]|uniref:hypothetical protein n=1 Tax=Propioniciclava sp. TaxID=2038686 RepID=UPI0039E4182F
MIHLAATGTPGDKSDLAVVPGLPIEAMIAIATDPEPFARSAIFTRRDLPEEVFAAALAKYPLDAPAFSAHWSAPGLLMESAPLGLLLEGMIQGYFDQNSTPAECQEIVWSLRSEVMRARDTALTLGQAIWIAGHQTQADADPEC